MLVMDATTTTTEEEEEEEKTRENKKSVRCCCSPALSARSWIFGCPSFFFFSDGRREKDYDVFCIADATSERNSCKKRVRHKQLTLLLIAEECLRRRLRTTISTTTKERRR